MDTQIRRMTFGKYKGRAILSLITTNVGYIAWALENVDRFHLTDMEQEYYDYIVIALKKYSIKLTCPSEKLQRYVKDKEALEKGETPLKCFNGIDLHIPSDNKLTPYLRKADAMKPQNAPTDSEIDSLIRRLAHCAVKEIKYNMTDDEIAEMDMYGCAPPPLDLVLGMLGE